MSDEPIGDASTADTPNPPLVAGSVRVACGDVELQEGVDFAVDYAEGRVTPIAGGAWPNLEGEIVNASATANGGRSPRGGAAQWKRERRGIRR